MKNQKLFGALRATTLAALCAGGLVLSTAGCTAESGPDAGSDGGDVPAATDGEKASGDKSCGEKSCGEKSCAGSEGASDEAADEGVEKSSGEKSCGEKSCGEKSCG